ncbi:MAG TPA: glycosyltransferase 87 family protein, partial [Acidimicrobiales bacterium]|nr:glycosyltransferase 87 family protein [Acidimicrobiales bacterium]
MSLARIRATSTWVVATAAAVVWLVSAGYMARFGTHWHLDLRVYRSAGHALYPGGSPFTAFFTESHLPFTYPPFALLVLSPLSLGRLGLIEALWWLASSAALVLTLYRLLTVNSCELPRRSVVVPSGPGLAKPRALAVAALVGAVATLALEPVRSNMD